MSIDKIVEQLLTIGPILHKRLNKGIPTIEISKQQLELLFCVFQENGKTMKYYGDKLMVSKSNLTILADKLIEEKYIERELDPEDRRVILLRITDKGRGFLEEQKERFKQAVMKKFEVLSSEDISKLNELFEEILCIFNKID